MTVSLCCEVCGGVCGVGGGVVCGLCGVGVLCGVCGCSVWGVWRGHMHAHMKLRGQLQPPHTLSPTPGNTI